MFLFLTSSMFSRYFRFVFLLFVIYLACVVDTARHGLTGEGSHSLRAVTEEQPAGMNAEKGGGYSKTFLNKDVELRGFYQLKA